MDCLISQGVHMRTLWLMAVFLAPVFALAQPENVAPSAGGFVVTTAPVKDGARATADLPASQHKRNVGGSDGAGLCVYTSVWHALIWQSVSELYGFRDWMKGHPGGSYPEKFEATLNQYCKEKGIPCPGYVQHTGGDVEVLELALKTGRMVCTTYCGVDGPGRYGAEVIGHMVNPIYLDKERACILDNNFPGTFLWMSRADFLARWRGLQANGSPYLGKDKWGRRFPIGGGWAIVFLAPPPAPYPEQPAVQSFRGATCDGCTCEVCACADKGKCPHCCPVLYGQCPGGRCPAPLQTVPSLPNPFGPVYPSGDPIPEQMPAERLPIPNRQPTAADFLRRPSAEYLWRDTPGVGVGWILPSGQFDWGRTANGWGWVPKIKPNPEPAPVEAAPNVGGNEFPRDGVLPEQLTTQKKYWCSGFPCTKEVAHAALALSDDSARWNLAIVGEPSFARKVREDLGAMPETIRAKLHVQSYAPDAWEVSQFKLVAGVTLRRPAQGRVGGDLGSIPTSDYSAPILANLMECDGGPNPRPKPKPVIVPNDTPSPTPAPKTPAPRAPTGGWIIAALIAGIVIVLIRR